MSRSFYLSAVIPGPYYSSLPGMELFLRSIVYPMSNQKEKK